MVATIDNMSELNDILKDYLNKCALIFAEKRSTPSKIVLLQKEIEITSRTTRTFFNQAITEAENTEEFSGVVNLLKNYPLFKGEHIKVIRMAANAFFINTGTYQSIWNKKEVKEYSLIDIINDTIRQKDYEVVSLFVFDGFELYDTKKNRNLLKEIKLPYGKLKILSKDEIEALFNIPENEWPINLNIDYLTNLHVLIISGREEYRKPTANDLGGIPARWDNFSSWREKRKREADVDHIGPLFLCLGEDVNLAEEIIIRKCIFDKQPISVFKRNDYLLEPRASYDGVYFYPRMSPKYIGQDGIMLSKFYEMWIEVNQIKGKNYLCYSTEAYVRSIMNWHQRPDSIMELFVSFITVIDSLLTRDGSGDLAYKIAARGAAILSPDSQKRIDIMSCLKKLYTIRSNIVHKGHTKREDLINFLVALPKIVGHIFIKFITIAHLFKNKLLNDEIMKHITDPKNPDKYIADILDLSVMKPEVVTNIDNKLSEMNIELEEIRIPSLV